MSFTLFMARRLPNLNPLLDMRGGVIWLLGWMLVTNTVAAEVVDKALLVDPTGEVRLNVPRGQVVLSGWSKSVVHVAGSLDSEARELVFETAGELTRVEVVAPDQLTGGQGSKLRVRLPQGSSVILNGHALAVDAAMIYGGVTLLTTSGDIRTEDTGGQLQITTVSAEVQITRHSGDAELTSTSGSMTLANVRGDVSVTSTSGQVQADLMARALQISTVSGSIQLVSTNASEVAVHSVSGDIDLQLEPAVKANIRAQSTSGDIRLMLPEGLQAQFDLNASAGGDIINELSNESVSETQGPAQRLAFVKGDNSQSKVSLSSLSGDLILGKQ